MRKMRAKWLASVTVAALAWAAGCQAPPEPGPRPEEYPPAKVVPPLAPAESSAQPQGRLSDADKQGIVQRALLNLQRVILSAQEREDLSDGPRPTTAAKDALTTKLSELTFNVVQSTDRIDYSPSERDQDDLRERGDFNLAILVDGAAKPADRFGNFWSFDGNLSGKAVNLTTHQIIASKTILKRGKRSTNESDAAESALQAAAIELVNYLTDQIARQWEATSLVKVDLELDDLKKAAYVDDVRVGLQRRPGVYYVSLEDWDTSRNVARYEVLCRYDVQRFLPTYVDELRAGRVHVLAVKQRGDEIRALARRFPPLRD